MADIEKVIKVYECCRNSWRRNCDDCPIKKDCCHDGLPEFAIGYALELLKEQQKKEIELIKKHTFSLGRADEFSMRKLYEVICETLMDEGQLIISRTDDHEKVNFVWEIRPEET